MGCTYSTRKQKVERIRKNRAKVVTSAQKKEEDLELVQQAELQLMTNKVREEYRIPGGVSLSPLPEFSLL